MLHISPHLQRRPLPSLQHLQRQQTDLQRGGGDACRQCRGRTPIRHPLPDPAGIRHQMSEERSTSRQESTVKNYWREIRFSPAPRIASKSQPLREQVADRAEAERIHLTPAAMLGRIVDHVATLAESREVSRVVVGRVVVEMGTGQDDAGDIDRLASSHGRWPRAAAPAVSPARGLVIPPDALPRRCTCRSWGRRQASHRPQGARLVMNRKQRRALQNEGHDDRRERVPVRAGAGLPRC